MATMTTSENNPWLYSLSLSDSSHTVIFETVNKFLDKNIRAEITVDAGTINKPTINNTNLGTYFDAGTSDSNSISLRPQVTNTKGFVSAHAAGSPIMGDYAYYTIKTAVADADNTNADVSVYTTDGSNEGINIFGIVGTKVTTEPTSGYYLAFKGSGRSKITTAGWITEGNLNTSTSGAKYFPITAAAGTVTKTSGSITPTASLGQTNVTFSNSNTSGVSVTAYGNGSATFVAQANITTAGYAPQKNNIWNSGSLSIAAAATDASSTQYITGVTIGTDKSFSVTNSGTTTVTSGSTSAGQVTIKAKVAAGNSSTTDQNVVSGGLWVNNNVGTTSNSVYTTKYGRTVVYYGTASSSHTINTNSFVTTSGASSSSYDFIITPRYTISKAGYLASTSNPVSGTAVYYKVVRTSIDQTHKTTIANDVATRAVADWNAGWLAAGSIGAATFAAAKDNSKEETDYVDISNTPSAPVLSSGGYLYINRGYVDDLKISLAKLVPDTISGKTMAPANYILTGYAAFDGSGAAINGTMAIYDGTYSVSS